MNFSKKNHEFKKNNRNIVSKTLKSILPKKALILLLISVMLGSCSSNDDSSDSGDSNYVLTAKVDGVNFSRDNVVVSALNSQTDFYTILAVGDTSIGLTLSSPVSTGTFTASETTVFSYQQNVPFIVWGANADAGSGTITITENTDTYIKGTFSFTGFNPADNTSKEVTEGVFKALKL